MTIALLQALAIASGGLSSLGSVLIVLLLLNREDAPRAAIAYFVGYFGSYLALGLVSVYLGASLIPVDAEGPAPTRSFVLVGLGLLILSLAFARWRNPPEEDPGPPPFLAQVDAATPAKAFGLAVLITAVNIKNLAIYLSAIAVLAAAQLAPTEAALAVLATNTLFCAGPLIPLLILALARRRAAAWLSRMRAWIETNSHRATLVVLPIIAAVLLAKGCRNLWLIYA